ncbi:MAG: large subunit ribosomal protein L21 [Vicingaceae bacterium]|jgi:large subunit ribosomal protein L21
MYAIVEIAGQQYKVEKDQQIFVHRLEGEEGSKVTFDNVLLTADGDKIQVGAPAVEGISVSGTILEHLKGDKVIVFKKKRRKGYKKRNGHRQYMTKLEITGFGTSTGSAASPKAKAAPKKAEAVKEEAPKAAKAPKKEAAKAAAPKKEEAPKTEVKKAPAKAKPAAKKADPTKEDDKKEDK